MPVDNSVMGCQVCDTKFTLITRRHWCRACLKTICTKCSSAFSQNSSLLSKLSRRHENNLCTLCQEATRFAVEERMLADAFKRHSERVPSSSANSARGGRQLFKDGEGSMDGPRRVASATPKLRSTSATLVRPHQQRRSSGSPISMEYGFQGDDITTTPPPGGFSAARRRQSSNSTVTPKRTCKSAMTPKRRMSVSFADNLSSFVEPASPFREGQSPASKTEETEEERRHKQDPCAVDAVEASKPEEITPVVIATPEDIAPKATTTVAAEDEGQENCSPKKVRRSGGLPKAFGDVKPILKSRTSTQQRVVVRNM